MTLCLSRRCAQAQIVSSGENKSLGWHRDLFMQYWLFQDGL
jgi:hypothetical protein